ncbi:MAG: response regulator [bacterium]|nr:response regulator [bacterium]
MARILVVNSEDESRLAIKLFLGDAYSIVEATDALDAFRVASETLPDCIIMDHALPDGDGITMARRIRTKIKGLKHVPVIICTPKESVPARQKEFADEFGFLPKPVHVGDLRAMVEKMTPASQHHPPSRGEEQ